MSDECVERRLAAILAGDVVGYSCLRRCEGSWIRTFAADCLDGAGQER
jgi:hypothetical protein